MDTDDMIAHDFHVYDSPYPGTVEFRDPHHADYVEHVEVSVFHQNDGAVVVQIDYTPSEDSFESGRLRVNVNDASVYDRNPETDEDFGDELHGSNR